MINRLLYQNLLDDLDFQKAIVVLGPRQVGKTTLINALTKNHQTLFLNGDDLQVRLQLSEANFNFLMQLVEGYDFIVVDEAQRIKNIGVTIKMLLDAKLGKQIVLSGSSSLDLANQISEPLTGRKWEHLLLPLSWKEVCDHYTFANAFPRFEEFLIYGMYPEIVTTKAKKRLLEFGK